MASRKGPQSPTTRNDTAGPGRPRRRPSSRATEPNLTNADREPNTDVPVWRRSLHLTRRALVVISVLIVLTFSFANTARIFLNQQHDLAVAEQQVRDRSGQIAELEAELAKWHDPAFIKIQARERLGWVLPGEIGYRVVDADGKPLGGEVVLEGAEQLPPGEHETVWWDRLLGSVKAADAPIRRVGTR